MEPLVRKDQQERMLRERKQAWWTSVLTGQIDQPYPVSGTRLTTRIENDILTVSGTVATEGDREAIRADVQRLIGHGVNAIEIDLTVASDSNDEESGLLLQTLMGVFESKAQAEFAQSYIHSQEQIHPIVSRVFAADTRDHLGTALGQLLADPYWEDVRAALEENQAILMLTVDETEAFPTREILDEQTRSLQTMVLPPVPAAIADQIRALLAEEVVTPPKGARSPTTRGRSDRDVLGGSPEAQENDRTNGC
jgi:hypothetical protein